MSSLIFIPRKTQTLGENDFSLLVNEDRIDDGDGTHMLSTAQGTTELTPVSNELTVSIWLKATFPAANQPPSWFMGFMNNFNMDVKNDVNLSKEIQFTVPDVQNSQSWSFDLKQIDNTANYPFSVTDTWVNLIIREAPGVIPSVFANGNLLTIANVGTFSSSTNSPSPVVLIPADAASGSSASFGFRGNIGHFAIWNKSLNNLEIFEIANPASGKPFELDLRTNSGNYVSASSLVEYWKPGAIADTSRFGESFITGRTHTLSNGGPDFNGRTSFQTIPLANRINDVPA